MTRDNALQKYDNVNPVTLEYVLNIGIREPVILDVGCWTGTLGRTLKERGFSCVVDGVDVDQDALRVAQNDCGYESIYHVDVNTVIPSDIAHPRYDIIVFGDVLEHVVDSGRVLRCLLPKLSDTGYYIVSLPNVAFLKYRWLHLLGNWNYTETGIMDKTHLRFFTLPSMKKLFSENGLEVISQKALVAAPKMYRPVAWLAKIWPNMFALQMVFKLRPMKHQGR